MKLQASFNVSIVMRSIIKNAFVLSILCSVSLALSACASSKTIVPEDLSAKQLIQGGQGYFEDGKYSVSLKYYAAAIERYGNTNPEIYVEAMYETGHIYMKQKKYDAAKNVFSDVVELYSMTMPGQLPGAYQKLAQIGLDRISKIENGDKTN